MVDEQKFLPLLGGRTDPFPVEISTDCSRHKGSGSATLDIVHGLL
jgi:hypothetical protein